MSGQRRFRPMPPDFPEHADESYKEIKAMYRVSDEVIVRWKDLCGVERQRGRQGRPVTRTDAQGKERTFFSIREAAQMTQGGSTSAIFRALQSGGKSAGYRWRYADR